MQLRSLATGPATAWTSQRKGSIKTLVKHTKKKQTIYWQHIICASFLVMGFDTKAGADVISRPTGWCFPFNQKTPQVRNLAQNCCPCLFSILGVFGIVVVSWSATGRVWKPNSLPIVQSLERQVFQHECGHQTPFDSSGCDCCLFQSLLSFWAQEWLHQYQIYKNSERRLNHQKQKLITMVLYSCIVQKNQLCTTYSKVSCRQFHFYVKYNCVQLTLMFIPHKLCQCLSEYQNTLIFKSSYAADLYQCGEIWIKTWQIASHPPLNY